MPSKAEKKDPHYPDYLQASIRPTRSLDKRKSSRANNQEPRLEKENQIVVAPQRASTITDPSNARKQRFNHKTFMKEFVEEMNRANESQIVRIYTRLVDKASNPENSCNQHAAIAVFVPIGITTRDLSKMISEKTNAKFEESRFTLRWIRLGAVEERVFDYDEAPLMSRPVDFYSADECRFYLCEHACQSKRRNIQIQSHIGKSGSVEVQVSCMLFVKHVLQVAMSKLNSASLDEEEYQLSVRPEGGKEYVLQMWDCPGCVDADTLHLTKKKIPAALRNQQLRRRRTLVGRVGSRLSRRTKSFRQRFNQDRGIKSSGEEMDEPEPDWADAQEISYSMVNSREPESLQVAPSYSLKGTKTKERGSIYSMLRLSRKSTSTFELDREEEMTGIFGALIADATHNGTAAPGPLEIFIPYVETYGRELMGIYRVNGGQAKMKTLRLSLQKGERPDFTNITAHNVAGVIKAYFRELPESLIPKTVIDNSGLENMEGEELETTLSTILSDLPAGNMLLLRSLCRHLYFIHKHNEINCMNCDNLGIVFHPNVGMPLNALVCLIANYCKLFHAEEPTLLEYKP